MIEFLIIGNMEDKQLRLLCLQKDMTLDALLEKTEKKEDVIKMSNDGKQQIWRKKGKLKTKGSGQI